ncbi:1-acyl-sn-glycerol-3-phosphate acyltransferase, partial [Haemophilus influenzae]
RIAELDEEIAKGN